MKTYRADHCRLLLRGLELVEKENATVEAHYSAGRIEKHNFYYDRDRRSIEELKLALHHTIEVSGNLPIPLQHSEE